MLKKTILIIVTLLLLVNISFAADIKTHFTTFNIVDKTIVVKTDVLFNSPTTGVFDFQLPSDYEALSVYIDGNSISLDIKDNILNFKLYRNSRISFNYVSSEFIDKTNFLMNMKLNYDIDNLIVKLVLSEGDSLKKPIKQGDLTSGSIYPIPTKATTDGRSLIFYWLKKDMKQGDEISIFTQIEQVRNYLPLILISTAVLFIAIGFAFIYKPKKSKESAKIIVEKEDMVEKHLKPDEEQIINIIKNKEGSCEQGTIRVVTGFSKAHLSRLLKELEERKVIFKEKRGKKNLVFLKK